MLTKKRTFKRCESWNNYLYCLEAGVIAIFINIKLTEYISWD